MVGNQFYCYHKLKNQIEGKEYFWWISSPISLNYMVIVAVLQKSFPFPYICLQFQKNDKCDIFHISGLHNLRFLITTRRSAPFGRLSARKKSRIFFSRNRKIFFWPIAIFSQRRSRIQSFIHIGPPISEKSVPDRGDRQTFFIIRISKSHFPHISHLHFKVTFFTKFTFSKSHSLQNHNFKVSFFHKIRIFKVSFSTKFAFSKPHFSQNSYFSNIKFLVISGKQVRLFFFLAQSVVHPK